MTRGINIALVGAGKFRGTDQGEGNFKNTDHSAHNFNKTDQGEGVSPNANNRLREIETLAYETGRAVAAEGWNLICGGLEGVMEAAARGANDNGGTTIGILPGHRHDEANPHINIAIPTGLGHARNAVIAVSADAMIAVGGEHGTLSEIALGLKLGKPVVDLVIPGKPKREIERLLHVNTPGEAINKIRHAIGGS